MPPSGRITTALAPHAPYTVDDADLAATAELAREHGLPIHIHASENRDQAETSLARHGVTPIEVLQRTGILDTDVLIAHGTGILDRDLPVLASATGRVAVATAPRGYLKFAWPTTTPVRALREIGIDVGLATDGAASNSSLDVWESMALTALIQKSTTGDPRWLTSRQALHHATLQSARAVGLGETIGSLAPGRRADIILVDLTGPHTQPVHDLAATLVHSARSSDVRTTIVDGRVLMRDRELLTIDVPGRRQGDGGADAGPPRPQPRQADPGLRHVRRAADAGRLDPRQPGRQPPGLSPRSTRWPFSPGLINRYMT